MNITIVAVGRAGKSPQADLFNTYIQRLPWPLTLKEVEEKRPLPDAQRMEKEGRLILAAIPDGAIVVAMDKDGKDFDSAGFAKAFENWRGMSIKNLCFVIGGSNGLSKDVMTRANQKMCMGRLTWPHMLARVMLAEQIYRAWAIIEGHPYHK